RGPAHRRHAARPNRDRSMLLEGQVAIICGIGPGLGRAAALLLAKEGADIALAARTEGRLTEVAREVEALGRRALVVPTDVTQPEQAKRLIDATFDAFGRIDVLLNNAFSQGAYQFLADVDVAEWRRTVDINLIGPMLTCKYVIPHMIAAKRGSIINVSSNSARRGIPRRSDYGASKAGLFLLTQSLAEELGPHGIRVNCIVPAHILGDTV